MRSCQRTKCLLVFAAMFCLCFPFFLPVFQSLVSISHVSPASVTVLLTGHNFTPQQFYLLFTRLNNSQGRRRFPNSLIMYSVTLFKENKPNYVFSSLDFVFPFFWVVWSFHCIPPFLKYMEEKDAVSSYKGSHQNYHFQL